MLFSYYIHISQYRPVRCFLERGSVMRKAREKQKNLNGHHFQAELLLPLSCQSNKQQQWKEMSSHPESLKGGGGTHSSQPLSDGPVIDWYLLAEIDERINNYFT